MSSFNLCTTVPRAFTISKDRCDTLEAIRIDQGSTTAKTDWRYLGMYNMRLSVSWSCHNPVWPHHVLSMSTPVKRQLAIVPDLSHSSSCLYLAANTRSQFHSFLYSQPFVLPWISKERLRYCQRRKWRHSSTPVCTYICHFPHPTLCYPYLRASLSNHVTKVFITTTTTVWNMFCSKSKWSQPSSFPTTRHHAWNTKCR